jgi:VWFA-related protein
MLIAWAASGVPAHTLRIENPNGGVSVEATASGRLEVQAFSPNRPVGQADVTATEQQDLLLLKTNPPDGAPIDLKIKLPYGTTLQVRTEAGPISVSGVFGTAELITESGDVLLEAPWDATRLRLMARQKPAEVKLPDGFKFAAYETNGNRGKSWSLEDRLPEARVGYSILHVDAGQAKRLTLRHKPIPQDSPIKLPWQAPAVLEAILAGEKRAGKTPRTAPKPSPSENRQEAPPKAPLADEGQALFTSEVRMVNFSAAVYDQDGRPLTGLQANDFTVMEDGVPQPIALAGAEEVPFNLVLLLDLSGSTKQNREDMKAAALRFLDIARPNDRVAVYALANDRFYVVSLLTDDRETLRRLIPALPEVSGGTPLYDALVLSHAEELRNHAGERNALIVISDGVDNQIYGELTPSQVSFDKLRKAARQFDSLLYPILLNAAEPGSRTTGWSRLARQRMEELAAATGGRLFPARSLQELEPVYAQIENELRAVYSVAYYPEDQRLDGAWHSVRITVNRPGARVRSRDGYVAQP